MKAFCPFQDDPSLLFAGRMAGTFRKEAILFFPKWHLWPSLIEIYGIEASILSFAMLCPHHTALQTRCSAGLRLS